MTARPGPDWPACMGPVCWPHRPAALAIVYPGRAYPYCASCAGIHRLGRSWAEKPAEPAEYLDLADHAQLAARIAEVQRLPEPLS